MKHWTVKWIGLAAVTISLIASSWAANAQLPNPFKSHYPYPSPSRSVVLTPTHPDAGGDSLTATAYDVDTITSQGSPSQSLSAEGFVMWREQSPVSLDLSITTAPARSYSVDLAMGIWSERENYGPCELEVTGLPGGKRSFPCPTSPYNTYRDMHIKLALPDSQSRRVNLHVTGHRYKAAYFYSATVAWK